MKKLFSTIIVLGLLFLNSCAQVDIPNLNPAAASIVQTKLQFVQNCKLIKHTKQAHAGYGTEAGDIKFAKIKIKNEVIELKATHYVVTEITSESEEGAILRYAMAVYASIYDCNQKPKIETVKKESEGPSSGTAFFIDNKGHILTNYHVVKVCKNKSKIIYKNEEIDVKLIAKDNSLDLALLKADLNNDHYLQFSSQPPEKLQKIIAAGYPFGKYLSDDIKYTSGIISSLKGFDDNSTLLQIDAALNPGNSGGPVVDEKTGELVAVAVAGLRKDMTESVNFAIKVASVKNFLQANNFNTALIKKNYNVETSADLSQILENTTLYTFCN